MSEQHHPSEKGREHRFGQGACHLHGHDHLALDAQAFRRACSCFDLGRYFYDIPAIWVDLDQHRQPVRTPALSGWALPEN